MEMTKGLTSTGNIVVSTPQEFFDGLARIFNFTLDVCALPENAKCSSYYTPDNDGLSLPWGGVYGAILPTEGKYLPGSRKATRSRGRTTTILFSCCFLPGQIQSGGGTGCRTRRI